MCGSHSDDGDRAERKNIRSVWVDGELQRNTAEKLAQPVKQRQPMVSVEVIVPTSSARRVDLASSVRAGCVTSTMGNQMLTDWSGRVCGAVYVYRTWMDGWCGYIGDGGEHTIWCASQRCAPHLKSNGEFGGCVSVCMCVRVRERVCGRYAGANMFARTNT